jgi:hypothetical protein
MKKVKVGFVVMGESFAATIEVPPKYFVDGKLNRNKLVNMLSCNMGVVIREVEGE